MTGRRAGVRALLLAEVVALAYPPPAPVRPAQAEPAVALLAGTLERFPAQ